MGRVFGRQHHTAHIVSPKRIHSDRCHNRRIDAARQAQQHFLKASLAHVVAQALHHHAVVLFKLRWHRHLLALDHAPAFDGLFQIDMCYLCVKRRHLKRQLAAGVQRKARPVKDLIILTTHHIEVN